MKILKYINKLLPFSKDNNINSSNNILVVSNTGFGDTILSTPAIKTLRKNFPNMDITFMVNHNFYELFKGFEYVNRIIKYKSGFFNQILTVKKLKKLNIDTVFLFHSNGPEDIFFAKLSGAKNILKMTHNKNHEYKNIFLNEAVKKEQHDIESRLDLVKLLNPNIIDTQMEVPKKFYNTKRFFKNSRKKYVAFQLGAQDSFKMWPIENFITLANKIHDEFEYVDIVILGATKYEKELTKTFLDKVQNKDKIIDLCGRTRVDKLPSIINNVETLVTNDTGTMHLAIALRKSTICLFGPTNSKIFGPYQDLDIHSVIQKDININSNSFSKKEWVQDTMNKINVNEVFLEVKKKIN